MTVARSHRVTLPPVGLRLGGLQKQQSALPTLPLSRSLIGPTVLQSQPGGGRLCQGNIMFEHREAFIENLRAGPEMRRRIFETLEQHCGQEFGSGRMGKSLYETFHSAIQDADMPDVLAEFERRFLPFVKGRRLPDTFEGRRAEMTDGRVTAAVGRARGWGWTGAPSAVTVIGAGVVVALATFNTILSKHSTHRKSTSSSIQVISPAARRTPPANSVRTLEDDGEAESAPVGSPANE